MKRVLFFIMLIVLSSFTYAICEPQEKFIDRLQDDCKEDNGICDDGEMILSDSDCELSLDVVTCYGDRCIFEEIWLAKILLVLMVYLLFQQKFNGTPWIFIILLVLILGFTDFQTLELSEAKVNNTVEIPQELENNNFLLKYGGKVMPSNPTLGIGIILVALFFIVKILTQRVDNRWTGRY